MWQLRTAKQFVFKTYWIDPRGFRMTEFFIYIFEEK